MLSSLHPISLLTRTDAELTTLFHSFYLLEYLKEIRDIRVVQRFPQDKLLTAHAILHSFGDMTRKYL